MSKTVKIPFGHQFLKDYDNRLRQENYQSGQVITAEEHEQNIREYYGYEVHVDRFGLEATLIMTEQQHMLFVLKYGAIKNSRIRT